MLDMDSQAREAPITTRKKKESAVLKKEGLLKACLIHDS